MSPRHQHIVGAGRVVCTMMWTPKHHPKVRPAGTSVSASRMCWCRPPMNRCCVGKASRGEGPSHETGSQSFDRPEHLWPRAGLAKGCHTATFPACDRLFPCADMPVRATHPHVPCAGGRASRRVGRAQATQRFDLRAHLRPPYTYASNCPPATYCTCPRLLLAMILVMTAPKGSTRGRIYGHSTDMPVSATHSHVMRAAGCPSRRL